MQIENIIKALRDLYLVLIALSLETAGHEITHELSLLKGIDGPTAILSNLDQFVPHVARGSIFLLTLVPFVMGAIVHLQRTFIDRVAAGQWVEPYAVIYEFFVLFFQGMLFIAWSHLCAGAGLWFEYVFLLVLLVDVLVTLPSRVWSLLKSDPTVKANWGLLNFLCVALTIILIKILQKIHMTPQEIQPIVAVIAAVRTVFDFRQNREFYFGNRKPGTPPPALVGPSTA
jgi:hypothetical protein